MATPTSAISRQMRPLSHRLRTLNLQPRRFQSIESLTESTASSPTTHDDTPIRTQDHPQILSYLKSEDSLALAQTKSRLVNLTSTVHRMESLVRSIVPSASRIQLDPSIPPYTPAFWKNKINELPHAAQTLHERANRINDNITDLEVAPYPADVEGSGTQAQKDQEEMENQTREEQMKMLWDLGNSEEADRKRLAVALRRFERDVDDFVRDVGKKPQPTFQRARQSLAENVKMQQQTDAQVSWKTGGGWGSTATKIEVQSEGSGGVRRTSNPFTIRYYGSHSVDARYSVGMSETAMSAQSERTAVPTKDEGAAKKTEPPADSTETAAVKQRQQEAKPTAKPGSIEAMQALLEAGMK